MAEQPTLDERVKQLEASYQTFATKSEVGKAKAEAVGAAVSAVGGSASATGASLSAGLVSGEANLVTSGIKLASFEFDLRSYIAENKLRRAKKDPDGLSDRINELKQEYERYVRELHPKFVRLNTEFPEVKSEAARAHRRIDGLRDDVRDSRQRLEQERRAIRDLRHESLNASPTLSTLSRSVRTLATIIGG
jgi:hypothetical protein